MRLGCADRRNRGLVRMVSLLWLILQIINLYVWLIIIQVVLSWLIAFNVINTNNRFVYMVGDFLYRVTEPAMRPIRRILPNLGGIDLSPLVLLLLLFFVQRLLIEYWPA
jgi:YggT family protein